MFVRFGKRQYCITTTFYDLHIMQACIFVLHTYRCAIILITVLWWPASRHQSNICDPSWRINHLGTTLQSRLAHRLAYRQLLMSRPHLINRIWFRCNCRDYFPLYTRVLSSRHATQLWLTNLLQRVAIFHRGSFLASTHLFDLYRSIPRIYRYETFVSSSSPETILT